MYKLEIKPEADKIFKKLSKKNINQLRIIHKKIQEIRESPFGYKFLRKHLQGFNRVHIDTHFVLIFRIDNVENKIIFYYFGHHDDVYNWRPKS